MKIEQFLRNAAYTKSLLPIGATMIAELKKHIAEKVTSHLKIIKEEAHSIAVSFYGNIVVFRIEVKWEKGIVTGQIAAYTQSTDSNHEETSLNVAYKFDYHGNINHLYLPDAFAPHFLAEVFSNLGDKELILRP